MGFNDLYKKLVYEILTNGTFVDGRNGRIIMLPFYSFVIDDMKNDHKLLLRRMFYRGVIGEFKTLIDPTPLTNVSQFAANGCNYWSPWAGPNGELTLDYHDELHPQLEDVIEQIKHTPGSRRHVISLWNHGNLKALSLPCCWHNLTFSVIESTLHLVWAQRSVDTMIGLPSDVYLAYLFMDHVCTETGLEMGSCMFSLSNVHIYGDHISNSKAILERTTDDYNVPLKFQIKA